MFLSVRLQRLTRKSLDSRESLRTRLEFAFTLSMVSVNFRVHVVNGDVKLFKQLANHSSKTFRQTDSELPNLPHPPSGNVARLGRGERGSAENGLTRDRASAMLLTQRIRCRFSVRLMISNNSTSTVDT